MRRHYPLNSVQLSEEMAKKSATHGGGEAAYEFKSIATNLRRLTMLSLMLILRRRLLLTDIAEGIREGRCHLGNIDSVVIRSRAAPQSFA